MIQNIDQTHILAINSYGRFSEKKDKDNSASFAEAMGSKTNKSSDANNRQEFDPKNSTKRSEAEEIIYDVIYSASDTAKTLKDIIGTKDLRDVTHKDVQEIADDLYEAEIIDFKEHMTLTIEENDDNGSLIYNDRQDQIKIWEERLAILEKSNGPKSVLERTKNILKILRNLQALRIPEHNN